MISRRADERAGDVPLRPRSADRSDRRSAVGGVERVKAAVEVFDQVLRVFEADMKAQGRAFRRPAGGAADARRGGRLDQALEPAPTGADAEEIERVDQRVDRRL